MKKCYDFDINLNVKQNVISVDTINSRGTRLSYNKLILSGDVKVKISNIRIYNGMFSARIEVSFPEDTVPNVYDAIQRCCRAIKNIADSKNIPIESAFVLIDRIGFDTCQSHFNAVLDALNKGLCIKVSTRKTATLYRV